MEPLHWDVHAEFLFLGTFIYHPTDSGKLQAGRIIVKKDTFVIILSTRGIAVYDTRQYWPVIRLITSQVGLTRRASRSLLFRAYIEVVVGFL